MTPPTNPMMAQPSTAKPRPPRPQGPRKVVVGTTIFTLFPSSRPYVSLDQRLQEIGQRLDDMAASAKANQGRGLDIAVFPENALNPPREGRSVVERAVELDEHVKAALGAMARRNQTYLVVSFNLLEDRKTGRVSNAAVLFDRKGRVAGIYRKFFCLADLDGEGVEGGKCPGDSFPVFETDFGRIGMLICYDVGFDDGFESYAADGVDLILWPSMSPQTLMPRLYARRFGFHIVSSTPRDNASVFDPLGEIVAQTTREGVVTHEIDLDYRIVHWQAALRNGDALREKYGDRVGYRYSNREDYGIFWSNDPGLPIGEMLKETGIITDEAHREMARTARKKLLGQ